MTGDSDADQSTGVTDPIKLSIGQHEKDVDAGLERSPICAEIFTGQIETPKGFEDGIFTLRPKLDDDHLDAAYVQIRLDKAVAVDTTFVVAFDRSYSSPYDNGGTADVIRDVWFGNANDAIGDRKGWTTITVKAGETRGITEAGSIIHSDPDVRGIEYFALEIRAVKDNGVDEFKCLDGIEGRVATPVAFDLNGDGRIGVTGETSSFDKSGLQMSEKTVQFDIDGDGDKEEIEWLSGDGDAFLFDNRDGNAMNDMNGSRLFGDADGHMNGYQKLAELDVDGDGMLRGEELNGLQLWVDNGDAILTADEIVNLSDIGITAISTGMELVNGDDSRALMQSFAEKEDGEQILTEDVWFMTA